MPAESPISRLLSVVDELDAEQAATLFARDGRLLTADGRCADGQAAVRELLTHFFRSLRSVSYRITDQWRDGNVWIAEVDATYVLRDGPRTDRLARAIVLRNGSDGIADVRVYGANEHDVAEHSTGEGMIIGGRWVPPL